MAKQELNTHELFMMRALQLARLGIGQVSPNPQVGSVVVCDNKIIGEGWHKKYGGPHAEVNAINAVEDKTLLPNSTVYVNLEPCSHFGKTPPCADMLIRANVKQVVIANIDSNPLVAGRGIEKIRAAGIDVITGVLEKEARVINKRFFTFIEQKRPYIILKWAQTADGFIARENYDSKWISNEYARHWVHKWRSEEDAILVGGSTAMHDNPKLNVRNWSGPDPIRIVIDRSLKLTRDLHLFDQSQKTICYNLLHNEEQENLSMVKLNENNFMIGLIEDLHQRKVQSLFVEGGATTLKLFIENDLWDESRIFVAPINFNKGIAAPYVTGDLKQELIQGHVLTTVYRSRAT